MGMLSGYLALWDGIWKVLFSGIVEIANTVSGSQALTPLNALVGQPTHIGTPTGEYGAFLFMTLMLHFIVLVAIMDRDRRG